MTLNQKNLPQLEGRPFLTDGGMETTLIFHEGCDLPLFSAYVLLEDPGGTNLLKDYYRRYLNIARQAGTGFILESATWRCSRDWGMKLGYDAARLADLNRKAVAVLEQLKGKFSGSAPIVLSCNIGPRGDGYRPETMMTADEAEAYHAEQITTFAGTAADLITAMTITHTGEAIGIIRAATNAGMPVVVSFTTETDGRLADHPRTRTGAADVSIIRTITCGTGDYADPIAEISQLLLRMTDDYGVRLQMAFVEEFGWNAAGDPARCERLGIGV